MLNRKEIARNEMAAQIVAAVSHEELAFAVYDFLMHTGWTHGKKCGTVTNLGAGIFDKPIGEIAVENLTIPF